MASHISEDEDEIFEPNGSDQISQLDYSNECIDTSILTDNGLTVDILANLPSNIKLKLNPIFCDLCSKYYNNDFVINYQNDNICYHCLFWLNYHENLRINVDGIYGLTITEYIIRCKDIHDTVNCDKNLSGGCFICEHLNGNFIFDIIDEEKINILLDKQKLITKDENIVINI